MHYDIAKIREARFKKGWNQTALAYHAGLSVATVSYVESGKRETPKAIAKIAKVLGLDLEQLVLSNGSHGSKPAKSSNGGNGHSRKARKESTRVEK